MQTVGYQTFRDAVCDADGCWQRNPLSEAGVRADLGPGWMYFRLERHYGSVACVGQSNTIAEICDGLAVPSQASRRKLVFIELKTSGKYAKAVEQIRAGVAVVLSHGVPADVSFSAEIWHRREPKNSISTHRVISVDGRDVFIRHRKSR